MMVDREWIAGYCTAGALLVVTLGWIWYHHPKYGKNIGPRVYPLVGSYDSLLRNRNRLLDWVTGMIRDSPTMTIRTVRPGGTEFHLTANPVNVEHILKTNFENYPKGDMNYARLHDLLGNGIFNVDGESWKLQRKVASHEFATRSLRNFMVGSVHEELYGRFIPILEAFSTTGKAVDLQDLLARFTFDTICKLGFGLDPACLDLSLPSVKFASAFDTATSASVSRFLTLPCIWETMRALNVGPEKKLRAALSDINDFAMFVINSRRAKALQNLASNHQNVDDAPHLDLLSRFMGLNVDSETGLDSSQGYSDEFLRDIVISFILAGRDSSTSGLTWFFWLLTHNRRVEDVICKEVAEILQAREGEEDHLEDEQVRGSFSFEELKRMHYLHAAVSESLRLYPPVPLDMKSAAGDDVWPDGTKVKAGSRIVYHPYSMGRMERIWGADCLEFRPERWLKDGAFVQESPYKYAVFQAGPRMCLGKELAMMQMKMVVAVLLQRFRFAVQDGFSPTYDLNLTMPMKHGLPVTVHSK